MENKGEKPIEFKALTDGLGFHPFSNGLPYAPITPQSTPRPAPKPNFESGTGAYSAGRPTFVTTQRVQVQRAAPQAQTLVAKAPPLLPIQPPHYGFEYIARRFLAYFVDSFLNMSLGAGTLFLVLWKQDSNLESLLNPSILVISALFLMFFNWAMITAQEVAFHTSVGKKFFGLQLHGSLGAILMRAILFVPSSAVFGLGVLWILFSGNGRCWHDSASGAQPQEIAEL
jgi:RDD family